MKLLKILLLALIFSLGIAVYAQDDTAEAEATVVMTVPAEVVTTAEPVSDVTIINEAPSDGVDETPVEPAPWWAPLLVYASLGFGAIWGFVKSVRIFVEGFNSRPAQVAMVETGYTNLVPAAIKPRVRSGGKAVLADIRGMVDALDRAFDEVTDEESILVEQERAKQSNVTKPLPDPEDPTPR